MPIRQPSRELNQRNVELVRLMQAWSDMLGDAHANLYRTPQNRQRNSRAGHGTVDNYFYEAQGYAHVMYYMMQAVKREYTPRLADQTGAGDAVRRSHRPVGQGGEVLKPLIVLDGAPDGIFANQPA